MQHENYACIGDRAEAVRHAIAVAEPGDIIIFAGKGHEDYPNYWQYKISTYRCGNRTVEAGV